MRPYGQYCGLARALDVIGERWSLLIVRELLVGPRRYKELLDDGLPGIATNLLAERLRGLQADGVIVRRDDGRYELTPWGQDLRAAVYALGRWAGPLMARPRGDDHFQMSWLQHMVIARFDGHDPKRRDLVVELRCEGETLTLRSAGGRVRLSPGPADDPDVTLEGPPDAVVGVLLGRMEPDQGAARGVATTGAWRRLGALHPRGERRPDAPGPTAG